jgi:heat shock protein HtpX
VTYWFGSIAVVFAGTLMFVARVGVYSGRRNFIFRLVLMIVAPLAAMLIQMAISCTREYGADAGSVKMSGNSEGLSSALIKISSGVKRRPFDELNTASAHMFTMSPLSARGLSALFSTHPPVEERVARLGCI